MKWTSKSPGLVKPLQSLSFIVLAMIGVTQEPVKR